MNTHKAGTLKEAIDRTFALTAQIEDVAGLASRLFYEESPEPDARYVASLGTLLLWIKEKSSEVMIQVEAIQIQANKLETKAPGK